MTFIFKNLVSWLTVIIMFLSSVIPGFRGIKGENIVILYTNDVHCAVENGLGYAGVSAYKKETEKKYENVTLVDCGDHVQGGVIGSYSEGSYIIDIMNAVGYDYAALGNHEFDYHIPKLSQLVSDAEFDYLCCNLSYSGDGENLLKDVKPYDIVDYGKTQVAYIGVTTPHTVASSLPKYFQNENGEFVYTFSSDTFFEVQKNVLEARAKGADYVVVLAHLGSNAEAEPYTASQLAAETVGIDAVLDAHSHATYNTDVKNKTGENVLVASTGTKLENMGRLEISVDGELSNTLISAEEYKEKDAEVQALIDSKNRDIDEKTNQKVGTTDYLLSISDESGTRMVRTRETNCGDFVADAYRYAGEADIGIANGGSIRDKINIGDITYKNLLSVVPYGNQLCKVKVTGQQIADALEFAYKNTQSEYSDGPNAVGEFGGFIQVSGLKFTVDTSVPSSVQMDENFMFTGVSGDRRVKDIMVEKDGGLVPLDMNEEYIVAGTAYSILEHGDGHTAFDGCTVLSNDFSVDVDALVSYLVDGLGGTVDSRYASAQGRITIK